MLRTPKSKFIASGHAAAWKKFLNEQANSAEEAMQCALLELAEELPLHTTMPQQACDAHQQMVGARNYMRILSSLHEPQPTTKTTQSPTLNYKAGI